MPRTTGLPEGPEAAEGSRGAMAWRRNVAVAGAMVLIRRIEENRIVSRCLQSLDCGYADSPRSRNLTTTEQEDLERAQDSQCAEDDSCPEDLSEVMDFSSYNLPTTIRLIVLSGECRKIEVKRGSRNGLIYIKAGEIYRVETNESLGDEAFFEILAWDRATHQDGKEPEPPEPNVRIATTVLLEAMKNRTYTR
jgi:hypothetical protein